MIPDFRGSGGGLIFLEGQDWGKFFMMKSKKNCFAP